MYKLRRERFLCTYSKNISGLGIGDELLYFNNCADRFDETWIKDYQFIDWLF